MNDENKKQKFTVEIITGIAIEAFKEGLKALSIVSIGAGFTYISTGFLGEIFKLLQTYQAPLFMIIFPIFTWGIYILYNKFKVNRPNFPEIETDFHILERRIHYEYISQTKAIYKKYYKLKALRNGLSAYGDRFRWTGEGSCEIRSTTGHEVKQTTKKDVWQLFEIHFFKTLRKGNVIETEVVWDLDATKREAEPFFSVKIEEPTDKLKLELILPLSLGVKEVVKEHAADSGVKIPFSSESEALDRNGMVVWEPPNPSLLHYYVIRWKFPQ